MIPYRAPKKSPTESPAVKRALHKLREFYQDGLRAIEAVGGNTRPQLDPKMDSEASQAPFRRN